MAGDTARGSRKHVKHRRSVARLHTLIAGHKADGTSTTGRDSAVVQQGQPTVSPFFIFFFTDLLEGGPHIVVQLCALAKVHRDRVLARGHTHHRRRHREQALVLHKVVGAAYRWLQRRGARVGSLSCRNASPAGKDAECRLQPCLPPQRVPGRQQQQQQQQQQHQSESCTAPLQVACCALCSLLPSCRPHNLNAPQGGAHNDELKGVHLVLAIPAAAAAGAVGQGAAQRHDAGKHACTPGEGRRVGRYYCLAATSAAAAWLHLHCTSSECAASCTVRHAAARRTNDCVQAALVLESQA